MERARVTQGTRTTVPARYRVRLHPDDLADVAAQTDGPDALAGRLADTALAFARAHGYHLPGRPSVALVADPAVERGVIEVDPIAPSAREAEAPPGHVVATTPPRVRDMPFVEPRATTEAEAGAEAAHARQTVEPVDGIGHAGEAARSLEIPAVVASAFADPVLAGDPAGVPGAGGIRGDGTQTLVFRRPAPVPTRAVLRVVGRDGTERVIEVDGTPLTLGRAADNVLVIADPRVSRHHGRLQARRGTLVFTDLGSTNGSRLNGVRVDECALGTGDRILVGDTVLLVEQLPG
jgi:hypothetical protein